MRTLRQIVAALDKFQPNQDNWLELDSLLEELWRSGEQEKCIPELLGIFERFPEDDGNGVFWSIVHGVERFPSYELQLLRSLARQPSEMGVVMLRRLINSGVRQIDGTEMDDIVHSLILNPKTTPSLQAFIANILK